jgi:FMN-dependent NADH-azoreductase
MNILVIQASPRGAQSLSTKYAQKAVLQLQEKFADATVTTLELSNLPLSFIDEHWLTWNYGDKEAMPEEGRKIMESNQAYSDQVLAADYIVISTPMYNFTVPAMLKAWIDQIVLPGKTFTYVEGKPVGLVKNVKQLLLVASNSGDMDQLASYGMDFLRPYIKTAMGYIGITNVESVAVSERMPDLNDVAEKKLEAIVQAY